MVRYNIQKHIFIVTNIKLTNTSIINIYFVFINFINFITHLVVRSFRLFQIFLKYQDYLYYYTLRHFLPQYPKNILCLNLFLIY